MQSNLSIPGQHANHGSNTLFMAWLLGSYRDRSDPRIALCSKSKRRRPAGQENNQELKTTSMATIMKDPFRVFLSLRIQCLVDCEYDCYLWMVAWLKHSCHDSSPFGLLASAFRTTQLHTMPLAEADQHLPSKFCRQGRAYILSQGHCIKPEY